MLALEWTTTEPCQGHAAGRRLLRQLVEEYTGKPMPEIAMGCRGKPYFPGSQLHFSITHTKHHVFCALSDRPIGIDAEEMDRKVSLTLANKILSPEELEQFAAAEDQALALLKFWVLKEATAKWEGTGLQGYPNHTNFSLDDPRVTIAHGCLLAVVE